jgi:hypothetical protein
MFTYRWTKTWRLTASVADNKRVSWVAVVSRWEKVPNSIAVNGRQVGTEKAVKLFGEGVTRGELSYLAPLGSENISAPYFKQCFFRGGGGYYPPDRVKHHASQSQTRKNKNFILYIEFCINNRI